MKYVELTWRQWIGLCVMLGENEALWPKNDADFDKVHLRINQPGDTQSLSFFIGRS